MALLVGILEMGDVLLEVVVVLYSHHRRRRASFTAGPVAGPWHGSLEPRGNAVRLLPESFGFAHSFAPPYARHAVVVLANVDRNVDFDEA